MTVKLLVNSAEPVNKAALSYAARVAKRLHNDLFVFSAMPRPETMLVYSGMDGAVAMSHGAAEAGRKQQEKRREDIEAMFSAVLQEENFSADDATVQHFADFPASQAVREAIVGGPLILPARSKRSRSRA